MKYFTALFTFLFSLFGVAFIVGLALRLIFPAKEPAVVGIGTDWRNIPGALFGIWAGGHGWKVVMRKAREKEEKHHQSPGPAR